MNKEKETIISKGGNASILYLPKRYFTPGEKVKSQLEVDSDGNVRMVLTKKLFNFSCDTIRDLVDNKFEIEFDKCIADTKILTAIADDLTINCFKSNQEIEPARVNISKCFSNIKSKEDYLQIKVFLRNLISKKFDAYLEPEGEIDSINVFKNPQKYDLKDEIQAIEALLGAGKELSFSVILRFNGKENTVDQIKAALMELQA